MSCCALQQDMLTKDTCTQPGIVLSSSLFLALPTKCPRGALAFLSGFLQVSCAQPSADNLGGLISNNTSNHSKPIAGQVLPQQLFQMFLGQIGISMR